MAASAPTPVAPADGAPAEAGPVTFRWEPAAAGADSTSAMYGLQVASDAGFEDVLFDERVGAGTEMTLGSLPRTAGVELHWRVRRQEASGAWGAWSEPARFRIEGEEGGAAASAAAGVGDDPTSEDVTTRRREWSWILAAIVVSTLGVGLAAYYLTAGVDFGGVDPAEVPEDTTAAAIAREEAEALRRLTTYEPVEDAPPGTYRIPIEQAMALVARDTAGAAPFSDLVTDSTVAVPAPAGQ